MPCPKRIRKRDGRIVKFRPEKIQNAIFKAITATRGTDGEESKKLTKEVLKILSRRYQGRVPTVEMIQDIVEEVLIKNGLVEIAKAYILYREQRRRIREARISVEEATDAVDSYLSEADWEVKENANMSYSLQGLNNYISSLVSKKYWLSKIYPPEIRQANEQGDFHIHNLNLLSTYCMGWDIQDLLIKGFGGVLGKVDSTPAKHLSSALGQIVNFFFTLQGEAAGAEAFSSFDTYLAPFIYYDNLSEKEVRQQLQEFLFNCNIPTRVGFQCPFENLTLDLKVPEHLRKQPVIIGGKPQDRVYGDFQEQMDMFNRIFAEVMAEGDASGRPFSFPIPTYNVTKDFDWDNLNYEPIWEMTAKYGIPYWSNFVSSDMKPEDARSMCCRLRLDNRQLYKRGGGLFGSAPLTGSIGVVTINLPRIGYLAKTKSEFFKRLSSLMDLAKKSLEIKRKTIERFMEKGLYPYSKVYLKSVKEMRGSYWGNHFSTIGLVGMNEALLNFMGVDITTEKGRNFALEVLKFMREKLVEYQKQTGNLYNLEATPAEGTSYRLALKDKQAYKDIITAGTEDSPYYTNSSQLPVNFQGGLWEALKLQDELQCAYTGGTVFHAFIGEKIENSSVVPCLLKKIFTNFQLPYFTFSPTFSICPKHGYIAGEHFNCPVCKEKTEVYSRIVGYLRPVQQWNKGKSQEFKEREEFSLKKESALVNS